MRQGNKLPPHKSRSAGFGSEQPEFVARSMATFRVCINNKQGAIIPLLKVLESLENFFQEVFKQGSGQRPEVFPHTPRA